MSIATWLREYDALGEPRCGTADDARTAAWLCDTAAGLGGEARLDAWPLQRIVPGDAGVEIDGAVIEGLPLFDAPSGGAEGTLGPLGGESDIGWLSVDPAAASLPGQEVAALRAASRHRGIILATGQGSLAPLNAPGFPGSFGPPVLQLPGHAAPRLAAASHARMRATYTRAPATSANVLASAGGADWLVLTPRTSWFTCTAERGGGIALWLELLRRGAARHYLASGGHELGHLGIKHAMRAQPMTAGMVLHLGASLGCAGDARLNVRAHEPGVAQRMARHLVAAGYAADALIVAPPGRVNGEAHDIAAAGLPFVSLIGTNPLFHAREDRLANVDVARVAIIAQACAAMIGSLSSGAPSD